MANLLLNTDIIRDNIDIVCSIDAVNIVLNTPILEKRTPPKRLPNKQQIANVEPITPIIEAGTFIKEK